MKRGLVLLVILLIPICFSKTVEVEEVGSGEMLVGMDGGPNYYAVLKDKIVASISSNVEYYHRDRLGNTILAGENKKSKTLPFGESLENEGIKYFFNGKELDNSRLYYFGARYYDYDTGRFISRDPIQENHVYVYVNNNPLKYVDPDGKDKKEEVPEFSFVRIEKEAVFDIPGPSVPVRIDAWAFGSENQGDRSIYTGGLDGCIAALIVLPEENAAALAHFHWNREHAEEVSEEMIDYFEGYTDLRVVFIGGYDEFSDPLFWDLVESFSSADFAIEIIPEALLGPGKIRDVSYDLEEERLYLREYIPPSEEGIRRVEDSSYKIELLED